VISCLSLGGPYEKLIPMQPSPKAETSKLLFPSLRFCISTRSEPFLCLQVRVCGRRNGIPILPINCLFLLGTGRTAHRKVILSQRRERRYCEESHKRIAR
jgi:hypothetical protein